MYRIRYFCVLALLVVGLASCQGVDTCQGRVVQTSPGKLTMTDLEGKNEYTTEVPPTAAVTREGKTATLADLQPGDTITVTPATTGIVLAVSKIEANPAGS